MPDWLRDSILYEINTSVWLHEWSVASGRQITLADVPERAWDELAVLRVSAVWFMGIWERSPASVKMALDKPSLLSEFRAALPDLRPAEDIVGSPYSIRRYRVDAQFGGPAALSTARRALEKRGIRMVLDFVPNHIAPDHPWVAAHPDWLLQGSSSDLRSDRAAFLQVGKHVLARGRDPFFPPWLDVLQLNAFSQEQRRAAISELGQIAEQCDGVRCDMAMLVMNEVFLRTWGQRAGAAPVQDYWPEVIAAVKSSHAQFRFIAEAYWDLERKLLDQGFDASYDKVLYDRLAYGSAESVREHLLRSAAVQDRLVRFLENHDEPRAARVFPGPKGLAAATVLMTVPGVHLLYEGQLEGRLVKTPVHLARRPEERVDSAVHEAYSRLIRLTSGRLFRDGHWFPCETSGGLDGVTHQRLLSWCWTDADECCLVVVNYNQHPAEGRVRFPWPALRQKSWRLVDLLRDEVSDQDGDQLVDIGLSVSLKPWGCRLARFERRA